MTESNVHGDVNEPKFANTPHPFKPEPNEFPWINMDELSRVFKNPDLYTQIDEGSNFNSHFAKEVNDEFAIQYVQDSCEEEPRKVFVMNSLMFLESQNNIFSLLKDLIEQLMRFSDEFLKKFFTGTGLRTILRISAAVAGCIIGYFSPQESNESKNDIDDNKEKEIGAKCKKEVEKKLPDGDKKNYENGIQNITKKTSILGKILNLNPKDLIRSLINFLNLSWPFKLALFGILVVDLCSYCKYLADKWEREKYEENFKGLITKTFNLFLGFEDRNFNPNSNHLFIVAIDLRRINVFFGGGSLFFEKNRTNFGTFVGRFDLNNPTDISKIPIQFPPLSQLPNTNVSSPGSFQLFLNKESIRFYNLARKSEGNFPRGFLQEEAKTQHIVDSLQSDSTYIQKESKNLRNAIKSAQERGKYLTRVETAVNMIYRRLNRNGFVGGLAEENLREISEDSGVNLDEVRILENMVITIRERIGANYTLENFMNEFHQTDREKASLIYETVRSLIH